jgi:RHS repeat-associated protein
MPVAMARNGTLYFVHPDHLGTPQKVTDASQNLVWDAVLRPFGRIEQESFTFTQLLRFPGQYHDTEDKLFYNVFRDYDPDLGRYVQSDPIGLLGGVNTYAYAHANPVTALDFWGLFWQYSQSTGQMSHVDDQTGVETPAGTGYSGQVGIGLNNPLLSDIPNIGPIPEGTFNIGPPYYNPTLGQETMNLTPTGGYASLLDRDLFRIHGDERGCDHCASEGCIIIDLNVRKKIAKSGDHKLVVVP